MKLTQVLGAGVVALGAVAAHDLTQKRHALLRNFPVLGHARYALEKIGPELRQCIVTSNEEEPAAHAGTIASAKVLGGPRGRVKAFRPASVVNISGMSFESMSGAAITALNKGAARAGCLHNTGRAGSRRTTATAATSCCRSGPRTSAAATSTAASTWPGSRRSSAPPPCAPSRSSSARAPSRVSGACFPRRR